MLVNLRKERTDLHMSLALILKHLQSERRVSWVGKVLLDVLAVQVCQTLL